MTIKQYSDLQRLIGTLDGLSAAIAGESPRGFYLDTVEALSESVEEIWREGGRTNGG